MIKWVDRILYGWGRWVVYKESAAIGYPDTCPMFRDSIGGAVPGSREPIGVSDDNYHDIHALVAGLPEVLRVVVAMHYQNAGSKRETADRCGISDKSVTQYLNTAHDILARQINKARDFADTPAA